MGSGKSLNRAETEGLGATGVGFGGEIGVGLVRTGVGAGRPHPHHLPRVGFSPS